MVGSRDVVIPSVVTNPQTGDQYTKGKFLGKGGFAHCYELTDFATKIVYAGKVVPKSLLQKKHQKDKMAQEVRIHRELLHPNIVHLYGFFEDNNFVFVLLELCPRRSLMELQKRRRTITVPEARYFMKQIVSACDYLHKRRVIHRDLKLGNLFLSDEMEVKVGDFGLATTLDTGGEMKKTLCGTPNYIAPEMLDKKGHSFEVDIWAIGCILYTLLVGKPPFETSTLKETYDRIKRNDYRIPSSVSSDASILIKRLLLADPNMRPKIEELPEFDFFTKGYTPAKLPITCLTSAPKFSSAILNQGDAPSRKREPSAACTPKIPMSARVSAIRVAGEALTTEGDGISAVDQADAFLSDLHTQLAALIQSKPADKAIIRMEEAEDPSATPVFWISRWVDYSDKYGLGYQLNDNSVGVVFNDCTKIVLNAAGQRFQYIDKTSGEQFYWMKDYPPELLKKVTLLNYFCSYMNEHLAKAGANIQPREGDELARLPFMRQWFRTRSAIVLFLSCGTLQVNFFQDHTKVVLCPLMEAVTYFDANRQFRVFPFKMISRYGCSKDLFSRLKYAHLMVQRLQNHEGCGRDRRTVSESPVAAPVAGTPGLEVLRTRGAQNRAVAPIRNQPQSAGPSSGLEHI